MFKNTKKLVDICNEEGKEIKQIVKIGVVLWCVGVAFYLSAICGVIYFAFWCLKHFKIIG